MLTLTLRVQRVGIGIVGAALAFRAEFGALRSDVASLDKRVTESNASLHARITDVGNRMNDMNSRITSMETSVGGLADDMKGVRVALAQLVQQSQRGGNSAPVLQLPAATARAPRGEGTS